MSTQWENSRNIKERIVIEADLVLETPTHLGNGDAEGPLDMPLMRDTLNGQQALLTGSNLAGALRNALYQRDASLADQLFGGVHGDESDESLLIVEDARSEPPQVELRDGVALDPRTRTAEKNKKFDIELLAAGTCFPLRLELLLPQDKEQLVDGLVIALQALESGQLGLGKRKRRGLGRCQVSSWKVCRYNMQKPADLAKWLEGDTSGAQQGDRIDQLLLKRSLPPQPPHGECHLIGEFAIDGSLLIRSYGKVGKKDEQVGNQPDMIHLHSLRNGEPKPILSGSSLAGALRARTVRIVNTLRQAQGADGRAGYTWAERIFGNKPKEGQKEKLTASRLWVEESVIENCLPLVQSRVKIDRFTGGAYPGALFSEQPVFGQANGRRGHSLKIDLRLEKAQEAEVGLLLLLLKDLWTGDLPLGGESSVGRGRLKGRTAHLFYQGQEWVFAQDDGGRLSISGDAAQLQEKFVDAFVREVGHEQA